MLVASDSNSVNPATVVSQSKCMHCEAAHCGYIWVKFVKGKFVK
jgi:hypothetical protein